MNRKKMLIGGALAAVVILSLIIFINSGGEGPEEVFVKAERGLFRVEVNTTGELQARNSTMIMGPGTLRKYRIYQVNIQSIIPEGTYVKKGEFVAALDPSEINGRIKDSQIQLDEKETKYLQAKLDTALVMREARDRLINLAYAVDEKQLVLDQSEYEPPAAIKRAEIELEKAKRELVQAEENYKIKEQQNIAKIQIALSSLKKEQLDMEGMMDLQRDFRILAPEDGMLIYKKGWDGKPIKEGSQIHAWDPAVATLPDLSSMNSITYVNEVDIRKITQGQLVEIGLDAFPDKKLSGKVASVANVGEQKPNSDSKVFRVVVEIDKIDDNLRPGMTTSNNIITKEVKDALFIPLECLHSYHDTVTYVFKSSGLSYEKQEVRIGDSNGNNVEIIEGLSQGQKLYLSTPMHSDDDPIALLPSMNGKRGKHGSNDEKLQTAVINH